MSPLVDRKLKPEVALSICITRPVESPLGVLASPLIVMLPVLVLIRLRSELLDRKTTAWVQPSVRVAETRPSSSTEPLSLTMAELNPLATLAELLTLPSVEKALVPNHSPALTQALAVLTP